MDLITVIFTILCGVVLVGYVQRLRSRRAMRFEWAIETVLDDDELERLIRRQLRGYLPLGRVHGSVSDGEFARRISRHAVQLSSKATVVVTITVTDRDAHRGGCTVHGLVQDSEVETFAGMAHPVWSAPLAAQRRLKALLRALRLAETPPASQVPLPPPESEYLRPAGS